MPRRAGCKYMKYMGIHLTKKHKMIVTNTRIQAVLCNCLIKKIEPVINVNCELIASAVMVKDR
jgi:hypothetical protein